MTALWQSVGPRRTLARARTLAALVLSVLLLSAGCGAEPSPPRQQTPDVAPPFADCSGLSAPPTPTSAVNASARPEAVEGSATAPAGLPSLELTCFIGGERVPLHEVRGPAVINLWASWCAPCRKELPAFQRLAERLDGEVHVVGVNSGDDREAARSLAEELGLTFPNLFDPDDQLRRALGRQFLPMTLFVDAEGRIRHLDSSGALDDAELAGLVEQHLGVVVPS